MKTKDNSFARMHLNNTRGTMLVEEHQLRRPAVSVGGCGRKNLPRRGLNPGFLSESQVT